jgi:hypothetical protein
MQQIINALVWIGNTIRGLWKPISILLAFLINPGGVVSEWSCKILKFIFGFFPSTPDNLKLSTLFVKAISSFDKTFPIFGGGMLKETINTVFAVAAIILVVKIYKLIPFKAT